MARDKQRGFISRLVPWLVVFGLGVGSGYYVRDQRQDRRLREAIERATDGLVDRGRELSESARDSAQSALRRLAGDSS